MDSDNDNNSDDNDDDDHIYTNIYLVNSLLYPPVHHTLPSRACTSLHTIIYLPDSERLILSYGAQLDDQPRKTHWTHPTRTG